MANGDKLREFIKNIGNERDLQKTLNEIRALQIPESPDVIQQRNIREQQLANAKLQGEIMQWEWDQAQQPPEQKTLGEGDIEYWKLKEQKYKAGIKEQEYLDMVGGPAKSAYYGGIPIGIDPYTNDVYLNDEDKYKAAIDIIYSQKKLGDKTIIDKQTGEEKVQDIMQYAYPETERIRQKQYLMDRQITVAELDLVESGFQPEQAQAYVEKGLEYATILVDNGFDDIGSDYESYVSMFDTRKGRREARRKGIEAGRNLEDYEADKLTELAAANFSNSQEIDQFIDFYYNGFGGGAFTKDDAAAIVRWDKNIVIKDRPEFQQVGE